MDIEKRGRGKARGRARGRGRGRARGRGRGRGRIVSSDEEVSQEQIVEETVVTDDIIATTITTIDAVEDAIASSNKENENDSPIEEPIIPPTIDMEADISQLEAPTFTTISRGPPEPMLRLKWDHKVSLIGEKVLNPMIHCCDQCDKPILIYGRMIPCKHIFCLKCARQEPIKNCPRCKDKVLRVEQSGLGTVFMCTHGGSRYGNNGCRRTYLSQRDLQAHINHRHVTPQQQSLLSAEATKGTQMLDSKALNILPRKPGDISVTSSVASAGTPTRSLQRPLTAHQFVTSMSSGGGGIPTSVSVSSSSRINLVNLSTQEAQQSLSKVSLQQQVSLASSNLSHHGTAAAATEQVASASYYSNALLSYTGTNRSHHAHSSTHTSSHTSLGQNYGGGSGTLSSIGSQNPNTGVHLSSSGVPSIISQTSLGHGGGVTLVPPPAHLSSQASVPPPPPPAPPHQGGAPGYYAAAYGQQFGQMPHYQFDQNNYPGGGGSGGSNQSQWNQQQYYR